MARSAGATVVSPFLNHFFFGRSGRAFEIATSVCMITVIHCMWALELELSSLFPYQPRLASPDHDGLQLLLLLLPVFFLCAFYIPLAVVCSC